MATTSDNSDCGSARASQKPLCLPPVRTTNDATSTWSRNPEHGTLRGVAGTTDEARGPLQHPGLSPAATRGIIHREAATLATGPHPRTRRSLYEMTRAPTVAVADGLEDALSLAVDQQRRSVPGSCSGATEADSVRAGARVLLLDLMDSRRPAVGVATLRRGQAVVPCAARRRRTRRRRTRTRSSGRSPTACCSSVTAVVRSTGRPSALYVGGVGGQQLEECEQVAVDVHGDVDFVRVVDHAGLGVSHGCSASPVVDRIRCGGAASARPTCSAFHSPSGRSST